MSIPTPTAAGDACQTDDLARRLKVIRGLLALNVDAVNNSEVEELERMHYQQSLWIQELQLIGRQLQTIVRDHEMQASVQKLERGMSLLGIPRTGPS